MRLHITITAEQAAKLLEEALAELPDDLRGRLLRSGKDAQRREFIRMAIERRLAQ